MAYDKFATLQANRFKDRTLCGVWRLRSAWQSVIVHLCHVYISVETEKRYLEGWEVTPIGEASSSTTHVIGDSNFAELKNYVDQFKDHRKI